MQGGLEIYQPARPTMSRRKFELKVPIQGTDLVAVGISMDVNGNQILRLQPRYGDHRGFSIQTNGNLPTLHRRGDWQFNTPEEARKASKEIHDYIDAFGTKRQTKMALNRGSGGRKRYKQSAAMIRHQRSNFTNYGWQPGKSTPTFRGKARDLTPKKFYGGASAPYRRR